MKRRAPSLNSPQRPAGSVNASSGGGSSIPNIFIVQSFQRNARVFVITFRKVKVQ